ncbi:MAG TPA: alpha-ketoacid dehydrogenase subunit beta [Bacteroidota bacterium]|jgi:2-oxoisovalerate dehydrogenase E1 component beta subunit|nr:alpha-ketoacid dehydrogenase subunit beta [Bacteroidota bacterium]
MARPLTYLDAISEGLREEMRRDKTVFLLGEDIGTYGGAFKVTKGFVEEFGEDRVIDTVLGESAIIGAASGAALAGMRPVAEMQFADFVSNGFNQIVNISAKYYYRNFVPVPMVVRLPSGGGINGGPFHSVNPEAWFFHVPGLKLVAPATPYDAKGLIKAAIRDPNPVLYFEHKYLYRHAKGDVPDGDYIVRIGEADIKRTGADISVITYGSGVHWSVDAAESIARDGVDVEVLDLRTLLPMDKEAILTSVKKTGKVLIVHEATLTGGIGGEVAALISEQAFEYLDAPIRRVASLDIPVPYAPTLEEYFLPNTQKVLEALRVLSAY